MILSEITSDDQFNLQKIEKNGTSYVIIGNEIERKTGFERGSIMSIFINNLKKFKKTQPGIKIAIKNTTEDLDFYSCVLRKLPDLYFMLDKDYATKYSKYSIEEWSKLANDYSIV